jgi:hypothetical protein
MTTSTRRFSPGKPGFFSFDARLMHLGRKIDPEKPALFAFDAP